MKPAYEELVVRPDKELPLGVLYVPPELIGYRVLLVPLEEIDHKWVKDAMSEKCPA